MKGWQEVKLGLLLKESKIVADNPNSANRLTVRLNMLGVEKRPKKNDKAGSTKYYVRKAGQFIYGKQNLHKGAFGIIPKELDGFESSSDIPSFDVDEICCPEWIYYYFKNGNFYEKLEKIAKGIGSKRIQPSQLYELEIHLPPKEEQELIIKKIQNVEDKHLKLLSVIRYQESLILKLRQSILNYAISGNLSKKWREKYLLAQSKNQSLDMSEAAVFVDSKIAGNPNLPVSKVDHKIKIPSSWKWIKLKHLIEDVRYGTSKKCEYGTGNTPVLRIPNIKDGSLDLSDLKSTDLSEREASELSLKEHDLLIIRSNGSESILGRSAVVMDVNQTLSFAGYLIRVRPISGVLYSHYLQIVLESQYIRDQIETPLRNASGVKNINSKTVKNFQIPLTEYIEQVEIVNNANNLKSIIDKFIVTIERTKKYANELLQAALENFLGKQNTMLTNNLKPPVQKSDVDVSRMMIYDSKSKFMDLIQLLEKFDKLHAEDLWKMSHHFNDKNIGESIDNFYADLKQKIEVDKTIKEVENQKGYLEII